jgi:hypothetical protein
MHRLDCVSSSTSTRFPSHPLTPAPTWKVLHLPQHLPCHALTIHKPPPLLQRRARRHHRGGEAAAEMAQHLLGFDWVIWGDTRSVNRLTVQDRLRLQFQTRNQNPPPWSCG